MRVYVCTTFGPVRCIRNQSRSRCFCFRFFTHSTLVEACEFAELTTGKYDSFVARGEEDEIDAT